MAKILVLTAGSTGDVAPFAELAGRLGDRGHEVVLAADAAFGHLAPNGPVRFEPIRADFQSLVPTPEGKKPSLRGDVFPVIRNLLADSSRVAQAERPGLIVAHEKTLAAPHIAEKLGIPHVQALTVPMLTPTRAFPLPGVVRRDLGGFLNRASYRLVAGLARPYSGLIRGLRREDLGLAESGRPPAPARTLYCYSPSLVPRPPDWPADVAVTGFWLGAGNDSAPAPDPALERFLAAGTQPVYVGFGSSVGRDPALLGTAAAEGARQAGVRAIIATGWGGMRDVSGDADTLVVERADHAWLFPRVAAVVHHGGAGTTAAGLLAARPTVVCPFQGDQHFWGAAVHCAGAGPEPLPARKLTPARLAAAIRTAVDNGGMQARALDLSGRMRAEDGTGQASEHIEAVLAG